MKPTINITGLMLRNEGDYIIVELEVGGEWHIVLREYAPLKEMAISHIVNVSGMEKALAPMGRCIRCGQPLNNVSPGFSIIAGVPKVCTHCLRPDEEIARAKSLT